MEGGRYRVEEEIARGGMGVVLRVKDGDLDRTLAMKRMASAPDETMGGAEASRFARFMEEAQVTAQLDHPAIVPVHELGFDEDGTGWYTMKLVEGRELGQVFELARARKEGWNEAKVLRVLVRVCQALAYAHGKGVLHRDLKPANVMVGEFGEVYVMDWGLARVAGSEVTSPREDDEIKGGGMTTLDGSVMGTPEFMSPEQARGEEVDEKSDIYSVGAMMYHFLAGRPPFQGEAREVVKLVARESPAALPKGELATICGKAMAREKGRRYESMVELGGEIQRYLDGRVVTAYERGWWAELRKWVGRNKGVSAALAGVMGLLVAMVIFQARANRVILESLDREEAAREEAVGSLGKMAAARGMTASRDLDYAKAAYWFAEAAGATWDAEVRESYAVRGRLAESRAAPPLRAVRVSAFSEAVGVLDLEFDPSGRFIVVDQNVSPNDGSQVVDVEGEKLFVDERGDDLFAGVAFCAMTGRMALSFFSGEPRVEIYESGWGKLVETLKVSGHVRAMAFSPGGERLFVGTNPGLIYHFEKGEFEAVHYVHPEGRVIGEVKFDRKGELLLTVTRRKRVEGQLYAGMRVFDTSSSNGEELFPAVPNWFFPNIARPHFSRDGERVVFIDRSNHEVTAKARTGEVLSEIGKSASAYSKDGRLGTSTFGVWESESGRSWFSGTLGDSKFSPVNSSVIAPEPLFREVAIRDGHTLRPLGLNRAEVRKVAVSPDGLMVAGWETTGLLRVWEMKQNDWSFWVGQQAGVVFSPDGEWVTSGGRAIEGKFPAISELQIHRSADGAKVADAIELGAHLCDAVFSPDGSEVAVALQKGTVQRWDWRTGESLSISQEMEAVPFAVRYSPDGKWLAATCLNGDLAMVDSASGKVRKLVEHSEIRTRVEEPFCLKGLEFSEDGKWLVMWSLCEGITIWDCEKMVRAKSPMMSEKFVDALDVRGDEVTFFDRDGYKVRQWDLALEREIREASEHRSGWASRIETDAAGRVLLSRRYLGYGELGGSDWKKLNGMGEGEMFFLPGSPWIVGLSTMEEGRFSLIDSRDGSDLAAPVIDPSGAYLYPVLSSGGRYLAALDQTWGDIGKVIDLRSLREGDARKELLGEEGKRRLLEINAGGRNEGGEWRSFSEEEWLEKWRGFREDFPKWHGLSR